MASLKEIERFLGSNETALNGSWVRPIYWWWISHNSNTGLCSFALDERENVTSVTTQVMTVACLPAVLAYSSPLVGGIGCCAEINSLFLWQATLFLGCLCSMDISTLPPLPVCEWASLGEHLLGSPRGIHLFSQGLHIWHHLASPF